MKPIEPVRLLLIGLLLALAGWFATVLSSRFSWPTPVLPATALATMGVIIVITLVLGLRVLRWRNSLSDRQNNGADGGNPVKRGTPGTSRKPSTQRSAKKAMLNPLLAARTVVLAQACAYAGTVLLGWHAGIFLDQLRVWSLGAGGGIMWLALAMVGGGLAMMAVGLLVEWFCRIPPDDAEGDGPGVPGETEGEGEYAYRGD